MKLGWTTFLLAAASAAAFAPAATNTRNGAAVATQQPTTTTALSLSSATEAAPFTQGPRVIRDELPIVYVYDHCPFCVRVRLALGIMNVKHNVHFLGNDDIATPTKLVGKKISPIFVSPTEEAVILKGMQIRPLLLLEPIECITLFVRRNSPMGQNFSFIHLTGNS